MLYSFVLLYIHVHTYSSYMYMSFAFDKLVAVLIDDSIRTCKPCAVLYGRCNYYVHVHVGGNHKISLTHHPSSRDIQVSLAMYVCLSGLWLSGLPYLSFSLFFKS